MIFVAYRYNITHHVLSRAISNYPYRREHVTHDFDE